jgi:methylmalonyl-CoA/ethylmalonyl-CoA epimerase
VYEHSVITTGEQFAFHHVGVACTDIDEEARHFEALGYLAESAPFEDPVQGVRGIFMSGQSPRMELLAPLGEVKCGVLAPWLAQGTKLYHVAYVVPHLDEAIAALRARRGKLVLAPVPAVAFAGRKIAFLMLPNQLLVELISSD